jgi:hypothetical protein
MILEGHHFKKINTFIFLNHNQIKGISQMSYTLFDCF